jgi:hypothetical protein
MATKPLSIKGTERRPSGCVSKAVEIALSTAYFVSLGLPALTALGPACPVVWQGRVGDHSPYADRR